MSLYSVKQVGSRHYVYVRVGERDTMRITPGYPDKESAEKDASEREARWETIKQRAKRVLRRAS